MEEFFRRDVKGVLLPAVSGVDTNGEGGCAASVQEDTDSGIERTAGRFKKVRTS